MDKVKKMLEFVEELSKESLWTSREEEYGFGFEDGRIMLAREIMKMLEE